VIPPVLPLHQSEASEIGRKFWYLSMICLIAAIGGLLFGLDTAVISGTIPFLERQFSLSPWYLGWVVSSALVGCIAGAAVAGVLSDRIGRRPPLLISAVLFIVSALGCALAWSPAALVVARLIGGIGIGIASMLSPLYIAEFSRPHLRGRMVAIYQLAITLGILAAYFMNAGLLHFSEASAATPMAEWLKFILVTEVWRGMLGIEAIPALIFLLLLICVPESPRWLVEQKRTEEAFEILSRTTDRQTADAEIKEIKVTLAQETGDLRQLLEPRWRRPLLIGLIMPLAGQLSGINAIIYYGPKIMEEAGFSLGSSLGGSVTVGLVLALFTILAMWKVDTLGRRPLLLSGISGCIFSLLLIGAFFHFGISAGPWLLIFISLFLASFAFSLGPIPWILISEIFPTAIRGRAMSIGTFTLWVGCALVGQTFPWLLSNLGPAWTFWLFAGLTSISLYAAWRLVFETKGKSLERMSSEIQAFE
jgi:SP family arabinose:H+ symporter-like MFS transporter